MRTPELSSCPCMCLRSACTPGDGISQSLVLVTVWECKLLGFEGFFKDCYEFKCKIRKQENSVQ